MKNNHGFKIGQKIETTVLFGATKIVCDNMQAFLEDQIKEKAILEIPNETTIGMLLESSQIQEITDHNGENKLRVLLVGLIVKLG